MGYLFAVIGGYLVGCSSMAFYLSKLKHVNLSKEGSGNLGASNTTILLGWKAGILVAVHDIVKAVAAVLLAQMMLPNLGHIGAVAGVSCVLGHIFPFYLKFRGGKGFASYFGVALAMDWKFALILAVILIFITLITDYIVCATITAAISIPIYLSFAAHSMPLLMILLIPTVVMLVKHRENYVRIYHGTEVGLRATRRGEHRIK